MMGSQEIHTDDWALYGGQEERPLETIAIKQQMYWLITPAG